MSNRIELERSFILNEAEEKRIMEKIKQLGYIEYVSFKKHRATYTKTINGIERNIMLDELKGIGKFIELEVLSEKEDKQKMLSELENFIDEFECQNLERKQMPYRDIAKKYEESLK